MRAKKEIKETEGLVSAANKFDDVYQRMEALANHAHDLIEKVGDEKLVDDWWSNMEEALQKMQEVSGEIREPTRSGMEEPTEEPTEESTDHAEVQEETNMNDIDETIARLSKLAGLAEAGGKKPDDDKDGIPNWADKNPKKKGGDEDRIEEAACSVCHEDPCECESVQESVELDECGTDMITGTDIPVLTTHDMNNTVPEEKETFHLNVRTPNKTMTFITDDPEEIIRVLRASGVAVEETNTVPSKDAYQPPVRAELPTQGQMNSTATETDEDYLAAPQAANPAPETPIGGGIGQALASHIANVAQKHFTPVEQPAAKEPAAPGIEADAANDAPTMAQDNKVTDESDDNDESDSKKPDYLDFDGDGDKEEPMTKALDDKDEDESDEDDEDEDDEEDKVNESLYRLLELSGVLYEGMKIRSAGYEKVEVVQNGKVVKTFKDPRDAKMWIAKQGKEKTVKESRLDELDQETLQSYYDKAKKGNIPGFGGQGPFTDKEFRRSKSMMGARDRIQDKKNPITAPKVHDFSNLDDGDVYDITQTDDSIADGDVLKLSGGRSAILYQAWPTMVVGTSDSLHHLKDDRKFEQIAGGRYVKSAALAKSAAGSATESITEKKDIEAAMYARKFSKMADKEKDPAKAAEHRKKSDEFKKKVNKESVEEGKQPDIEAAMYARKFSKMADKEKDPAKAAEHLAKSDEFKKKIRKESVDEAKQPDIEAAMYARKFSKMADKEKDPAKAAEHLAKSDEFKKKIRKESVDATVQEHINILRKLSGYAPVAEGKWGNSVAGPSGDPAVMGNTEDFGQKGTGKGKSGRGDKGLATVGDNPLGYNDRDLTEAKMMSDFARFVEENKS